MMNDIVYYCFRMGPTCRLLCLVLGYLLYLFMGATIFSAIEHPIEGEMINQLQQEKTQFLQENKCVKGISEVANQPTLD